jgi:hypothetical protein
MARHSDPFTKPDGSFDVAAYDTDQARVPKREEVGLGSVWEIDPSHDDLAGVWKVEKVNPTTFLLVNTTGARLKAPLALLRRTDKPYVTQDLYRPHTGAVVTVAADVGGARGLKAGTAYVVTQTVGLENVKVAQLGDDDGLVWSKIPITLLQPYRGTLTF